MLASPPSPASSHPLTTRLARAMRHAAVLLVLGCEGATPDESPVTSTPSLGAPHTAKATGALSTAANVVGSASSKSRDRLRLAIDVSKLRPDPTGAIAEIREPVSGVTLERVLVDADPLRRREDESKVVLDLASSVHLPGYEVKVTLGYRDGATETTTASVTAEWLDTVALAPSVDSPALAASKTTTSMAKKAKWKEAQKSANGGVK